MYKVSLKKLFPAFYGPTVNIHKNSVLKPISDSGFMWAIFYNVCEHVQEYWLVYLQVILALIESVLNFKFIAVIFEAQWTLNIQSNNIGWLVHFRTIWYLICVGQSKRDKENKLILLTTWLPIHWRKLYLYSAISLSYLLTSSGSTGAIPTCIKGVSNIIIIKKGLQNLVALYAGREFTIVGQEQKTTYTVYFDIQKRDWYSL